MCWTVHEKVQFQKNYLQGRPQVHVFAGLVGAKLPSRLQESSPESLLTKPGCKSGVPGFTNLLRNCVNT